VAETIFNELSPFFRTMGKRTEDSEAEPIKKQALRDFNALESGKRKIVDETFKDNAEFKETEQGEFKE